MTDLKRELRTTVESWRDKTFNIIHIDVINHTFNATEEYLYDLIEPTNIDYDDFFNDYSKHDEYNEWCEENEYEGSDSDEDDVKEEFCNQDNDFQSYQDRLQDDNGPMWNYCFETKGSSWPSLTKAALNAGCGVINESEYFNDTVFMKSAGHSFLSAYFIPIYLEIFQDEAEKYKGIDYSDL